MSGAMGAAYSWHQTQEQQRGLEAELAAAQQRDQQKSKAAFATTLNFTHTLPSREKSDDIVKDIGKFASATGVQIQSIQVRTREASESEYGSLEFSITLNGDYKSTKAWLAELLARYHTMTIATLSMQPGGQEVARLESQISLIFYARN